MGPSIDSPLHHSSTRYPDFPWIFHSVLDRCRYYLCDRHRESTCVDGRAQTGSGTGRKQEADVNKGDRRGASVVHETAATGVRVRHSRPPATVERDETNPPAQRKAWIIGPEPAAHLACLPHCFDLLPFFSPGLSRQIS